MDYLVHYGILGQKWGIRRFQNADGSLTDEGRIRYGKGLKGKKQFAKDLEKDLLSAKNDTDYKKKIKTWGKTAEESNILDPHDVKSIFDASNSSQQTDMLYNVYKNMPSKIQSDNDTYTKAAKVWKRDADAIRKENMDRLKEGIDETYPDFYNEWGLPKSKDTPSEYMMKAVKAFNELDPDEVLFQQMDDMPDAFDKGYIDTKTFKKYYDAIAADDAFDYVMDGTRNADFIKDYHDSYDRLLSNRSDETRLNQMFGKDSLTHYYIANPYVG